MITESIRFGQTTTASLWQEIALERAHLRTFNPWECFQAYDAAIDGARFIQARERELSRRGVSQTELDAAFQRQRPDIVKG